MKQTYRDRGQTDSCKRGGGWLEGLSKKQNREKKFMDMDNTVVIARVGGVEEGIGG